MSKIELENRYLESFCDRDVEKVLSAEEKMPLYEKRAELRIKLKQAPESDKEAIQKEIQEITERIEER
jgi:hypothetical protein